MSYIKDIDDYNKTISTKEEIEKFLNGQVSGGTVSWHIPHEVHKIPNAIVRTYSPPVGASIQLEAMEASDGKGWVAKFTKFARWDIGAETTLRRLELKYDKVAHSLVAFDEPVSDYLMLKEYRVHWTHLQGRLRDVMIWEEASGDQLATTYVWCGKYIDEDEES